MSKIINAIEQTLNGNNKEYFNLHEAAKFLGISPETLYKKNHRKEIPYFKPNGSKMCYYKVSDLTAYMTANSFLSKQQLDERVRQLRNGKNNGHV